MTFVNLASSSTAQRHVFDAMPTERLLWGLENEGRKGQLRVAM